MKLKLLFLLFLASLPSFAQYTLIPDVNFENKLIALGIDSGTADGQVLTSSISSRKSLSVSSSSIADLTGIQDFIALTTLICDNNQLTNLDVSKNTALTVLYCYQNQLTDIDISNNTALTYLDCSWNNLKTLDVSKNTALTNLGCHYNSLTTLNVSNNTALTTLYCENNQLTVLDVSKNTALTKLNCSSNQLPTLNLANNIALTDLGCHLNLLMTLDVSYNTALTTLYCDNNQLTTLDVSKNIALIHLACQSNPLTVLDVSKNTALTNLDCFSNQLTVLDVSKNTALTNLRCFSNKLISLNLKNGNNLNFSSIGTDFTKNSNLTCIQVDDVAYSNANWTAAKDAKASYSSIACPNPYTLIPDVNFEKRLGSIDIDGVNGKVLTSRISSLKSLNVSSSSITDLTGIQDFIALTTLICDNNQLTNLDVSKNTALTVLYCYQNQLTDIDISNNTALTDFYCYNNQLTTLDLSKNTALINLHCNGNQLTNLDVSNNTALTKLRCVANQLTSLNLKNGNNINFTMSYFGLSLNPNLTCIQVDDVAYSNANWSTRKDATASFGTSCPTLLGTAESVFNTIAVYPNPVKGDLHIDNSILEKATVYDALGKLVKTKKFAEGSNNNTINLAGLPGGIYYIYLESQGATIVKKIIVE